MLFVLSKACNMLPLVKYEALLKWIFLVAFETLFVIKYASLVLWTVKMYSTLRFSTCKQYTICFWNVFNSFETFYSAFICRHNIQCKLSLSFRLTQPFFLFSKNFYSFESFYCVFRCRTETSIKFSLCKIIAKLLFYASKSF